MPENKKDKKMQENSSNLLGANRQNSANQKSSVFGENLDKFKTLASFVIWYP